MLYMKRNHKMKTINYYFRMSTASFISDDFDMDLFAKNFEESARLESMATALERRTIQIHDDIFKFSSKLNTELLNKERRIIQTIPNIPDIKTSVDTEVQKIISVNEQYRYLGFGSPISALSFSWNNKQIAAGSYSNIYLTERDDLLKWENTKVISVSGPMAYVRAIAYHPSDRLISFSGASGVFYFFDLPTMRTISTLKMHNNIIMSLKFTSDGSKSLSLSRDGVLNVVDLFENKLQRKIKLGATTTTMALAKDDTIVACGLSDGRVGIFDNRVPGECQYIYAHKEAISALDISLNGVLATGGGDNCARIWDLRATDGIGATALLARHTGHVCGLQFDHNDNIWTSCDNGEVQAFDLNSGRALGRRVFDGRIICFNFDHVGNGLIFSNDRNELHLLSTSVIIS